MMAISISGQVPGESVNAMVTLDEEWQKDITPEPVYAVVKIERAGFKHDDSKQERRPIMKVSHIEIPDQGTAQQLLRDAYEARTGENALDLASLDDEDGD